MTPEEMRQLDPDHHYTDEQLRAAAAAGRRYEAACGGDAVNACASVSDRPWQYGCTICDPQIVQRGTHDMCDEHRAEFYAWRRDGAPDLPQESDT